jgi:cobalt-zinc-cadmium efflux system membrane fusion protein
MRAPPLHRAAIALLVPLAACSIAACKGGAAEATGKPEPPRGAEAAKAAAPGELCEHGVLKVICPKCNPKLAAVFQAKGDWCAEHGLPESVCPICHPERGGKPASDVGSAEGDGAPADGLKIRFKKRDTAAWAGILTAKAALRPNSGGVLATARIAYDATKVAEINARSPGIIRALKVDVGAKVKKGAALAVIDSPNVGAERSRLAAASSRVKTAEEHLKREKQLQDEGINARKDVLHAQQELDAAKAELGALAASLSVIGAGAGSPGSYVLTAPIDGVVTQRKATIGKLVGLEEMLFEVVDTSAMWADLDVPEADLALVAAGQPVTVTIDVLGAREFKGSISYIAPSIDAHTRTAIARVPLENPDSALRAGMFGQARISAGGARVSVMVPRAAVQRAKSVELVFVRIAEDQFETRRVETGAVEGDLVELTKGVRPGEDVATQGSFLLKTETLKESIGAGCCDAD